MRSSTFVMLLGLLIAIAPYSGFYGSWEQVAITVMGLLVFLTGLYVSNKKRLFRWAETVVAKKQAGNPEIENLPEIDEVEYINKGE